VCSLQYSDGSIHGGNGILLDDTTVLTNVHVIEGGERAWIELEGQPGEIEIISVLAWDERRDLAIASIEPIGGSAPLRVVGDRAENPGAVRIIPAESAELGADILEADRVFSVTIHEMPYYIARVHGTEGYSGSPWLSETGECFAITTVGAPGVAFGVAVDAQVLAGLKATPTPYQEWSLARGNPMFQAREELKLLEELYAKGSFGQIHDAIARLMNQYPGRWEVEYSCSTVALAIGEPELSLSCVRRLASGSDAPILYADIAALAWARLGCWEEGIGALHEAFAHVGATQEWIGRMAEAAYLLQDERADVISAIWLDLDPVSYEPRFLRGRVLLGMERYQEAIDVFRALEQEMARGDLLCAYIATCHSRLDQNADAVRWLRRAVQFAPNNSDWRYRLGYALWLQDEFEEALQAFNHIAPDDEEWIHSRIAVAHVLRELDRATEAVVELLGSLEGISLEQSGREILCYVAAELPEWNEADEIALGWCRTGAVSPEVTDYVFELWHADGHEYER
jgi:tetratricopeptide (TPR) repeat protein